MIAATLNIVHLQLKLKSYHHRYDLFQQLFKKQLKGFIFK